MNLRLMAAALTVAMSAGAAMAVPAKRDVIHRIAQPDGSVVELTRLGDERAHIYLTTDRVPVIADAEGRYCYATLNADGTVVASRFQASNPELRTAAERQFVGSIDTEAVARRMFARPAPMRSNQSSGIGLYDALFPHSGDVHALVILVQFSDIKFKVPDAHNYFTDFLNKEGFSADKATGSVRDYFVKSSMGQFTPTFDLYGPVTLPNRCEYYGGNDVFGNDKRAGEMVYDACRLLDDEINFADYDLNNDGRVDNVYIIYAGQGEASYGDENTIWPHRWEMQYAYNSMPVFDGKRVNDYGCCNEWGEVSVDGVGTFCHEFSHVMGLPDLYYTGGDYYSPINNITPGSWSVLDYGPYNNDGRTPPIYSAFERNAMGWIDPVVLKDDDSIELRNLHDSNDVAIVLTDDPNEFYMFENRQQVGWDTYVPGHGMLVWHVRYRPSAWSSNGPNNGEEQNVDIVEASGLADNSDWETMQSYPFPGTSRVTSFTDDTTPSMRTWSGKALGVPLYNITEQGGVITFDVRDGYAELAVPQLSASAVRGNGFTLSWPAVDKALSYTVNVYTKDEGGNIEPLNGYTDLTVSENSLEVTRISPLTRYYATAVAVRGKHSSELSDELEVVTGEATFDLLVPVVKPATALTATGFVANWDAVEGAESYLLDVSAFTDIEPATSMADFGSDNSFKINAGWSGNSSDYYTSANYVGPESGRPSLKLAKLGQYIQTPVYEDNVISFEAWVRNAGNSKINYLEVQGLTAKPGQPVTDDDWILLLKHEEISYQQGGELIEVSDIPEGVHAVKLVFYKLGAGNLAVDDIKVCVGGEREVAMPDFTARNVGNVTSYAVAAPQGVTRMSYTVTAVNAAGVKSDVSDLMEVKLSSSVTDAVAAGNSVRALDGAIAIDAADESAPVVVADAAGRVLASFTGSATVSVAPGFYVVRIGAAAGKVIVR